MWSLMAAADALGDSACAASAAVVAVGRLLGRRSDRPQQSPFEIVYLESGADGRQKKCRAVFFFFGNLIPRRFLDSELIC